MCGGQQFAAGCRVPQRGASGPWAHGIRESSGRQRLALTAGVCLCAVVSSLLLAVASHSAVHRVLWAHGIRESSGRQRLALTAGVCLCAVVSSSLLAVASHCAVHRVLGPTASARARVASA